ncbi:3D-(3,5/4)-trihydroxycyclohexane-1,2-dione acylhydrolase (decyclizing) [Mangrovactinospora gilvigrisea]|uniref:3D-(3,5/4)-trihydroxycyclohexane-1,2-dione acylhydrolase (Decyclizing) n=1 Tax=Mangrovactinospora gilvigrisea TaxID=1428644 RepID=A0A1J7C3X9_9ACTN|nr:3D-(3,5/4)-trihydroxycyclohexane-1,2-dione acylhydrolase (decyclizing) [Mangrovactinospora gilvigrisea]OIV36268.1 3D-(3,5/4)-trihydroxycyclohexane-1,2-dione acylhydrolase (decyclizing) [Mangrovactinospora gilvigrisea]
MTTVRLTTAQALVRYLSAQYTERDGTRRRLVERTLAIFGHGNVAGLGQALDQADPAEMPFLQGRNEQAMVHAATAYARASDRASTWAVTTSIGPGATNLVTGAALATVNRLPVLLLPGDVFATRVADPVLQQLELPHTADTTVNDTLRPVSRFFDRIWRPEMLLTAAPQAMRVLTDPVETGAVTLALPQDVQAEAFDWPVEFFRERTWHIRRPAPDEAELAAAARLLTSARRPVIVAGGGVHYSGAEAELTAFAEATGTPVVETQAGKGAIDGRHRLNLGGVGHTGTAAADRAAREADLVIAVGTRLSDFTTASSTLFANPDVAFLGINVAAFDAAKLAAEPLVADARTALARLRDATAEAGWTADAAWTARAEADRTAWQQVVDRAHLIPSRDARPTQAQLLGLLEEAMADTDVVINAAGSAPGDLHRTWTARDRLQYHVEYGFSCMGYEIPAALGAAVALPDRHVFALVGDGTYLMNPGEIVTAVQEGVPVTYVLVQNHGYASIGGLSEQVGARRFGTAYRYRDDADGRFTGGPLPVDLAANAESLGVKVWRASTAAEAAEALAAARAWPTPSAVHVEVAPAAAPGDAGAAPAAEAWWDVPVAETSETPETQAARKTYESHKPTQRRHL